MTSEGEGNAEGAVHASWTYTAGDMRSYQKLVSQRWWAYETDLDDPFYFRYVVAVLCILAGLASYFLGAVPNIRNPTVPLACGAVYYLARAIEDWLVARRFRRTYARALDDVQRRPFTIEIDKDRVLLKGPQEQYLIEWPRVFAVRFTNGLLLFWLSERNAIYVPARAFAGPDLAKARAIASSQVAANKC